MILDSIMAQASKLEVFERRSMSAEYCELVFFSQDLDTWHIILASVLGEPKKPAGREPTEADLGITSGTGGIRINQTLFERNFGDMTVIAKFWPWGDERYITLKMAVLYD